MRGVHSMQDLIASWPLHGFMLLIITLTEMVLNFGRTSSDSTVYIQLATTGTSPFRGVMIRFMLPFVASAVWKLTGYSSSLPALSVIISLINCLFWAGAVVVSYGIGSLLRDRATGFFTALFFTTSVPVLAYGSSVLTDMSGYFFAGLALLILLADRKGSPQRAATEGAVLALGGFFHPTAFLGLSFTLVRRLFKGRALETLAGSALILVPVGLIAFVGGWFRRGLPFVSALFPPYHLAQGPRFDQALLYTFGILGLGYLGVGLERRLPGPGIPVLTFALFALVAILGIHAVPKKRIVLAYLLLMALPTIVGARLIERYLFYMWPSMIPVLVLGLRRLMEVPNQLLSVAALHGFQLRSLKMLTERIANHKDLCVGVCLSVVAVLNTFSVLRFL